MFSSEWVAGAVVRWDEVTFLVSKSPILLEVAPIQVEQDRIPTQQIWVRTRDALNRDRIHPYYPRFNEVWYPDSPEPVDGAQDPTVRAIYLHAVSIADRHLCLRGC